MKPELFPPKSIWLQGREREGARDVPGFPRPLSAGPGREPQAFPEVRLFPWSLQRDRLPDPGSWGGYTDL